MQGYGSLELLVKPNLIKSEEVPTELCRWIVVLALDSDQTVGDADLWEVFVAHVILESFNQLWIYAEILLAEDLAVSLHLELEAHVPTVDQVKLILLVSTLAINVVVTRLYVLFYVICKEWIKFHS